ncbi:MAG: hypothetical protein F4X99_01805 [Gammaproteobacteria bacterium]|nr:hypothetical protein [Gammaproteobacteria bacterium]
MWNDWRSREVPHWTMVGLLALWLLVALTTPERLGFEPWTGLVCGGVALALGTLCYAFGWWGAGDAKLLAVLALWMGPHDLPAALLGTVAVGLLLLTIGLVVPRNDFRKRGVPFAVALAVPAATVLAARVAELRA